MFIKGQTLIQMMEKWAPKHYAETDDRIGLQLGTLHKEIVNALIALDVTDAVIDEAIRIHANLIIAHHAIIYRPLQHIHTESPAGRIYEKLIKHDIAVYIAHTNLDVTTGGINDMMADALALTEIKCLKEPALTHNPAVGLVGMGRIGKLPETMSLAQLAEKVKAAFDVPMVRLVGDIDNRVRKAAVLGGSGGRYWSQAVFAGADVLITGDIDYHTAHDALAAGLCLIDPGHNSEKIMKQATADYLTQQVVSGKYKTEIIASSIDTEPFKFL